MANPSISHGLHGLAVLDDETIHWLLNACSEIYSATTHWIGTTDSNDDHNAVEIQQILRMDFTTTAIFSLKQSVNISKQGQ